jgi:autotransporter-associated beta strand protein
MNTHSPTFRPYGGFLLTAALAVLTTATARADYHSTVLGDKPIAYYPINLSVDPIGTTARDLSGNGNDGAYHGTDPEHNTVPGPSPYIPYGLHFDGFTSFVDLGTGSNPGLLNFSGPITLEAWVQPANNTEAMAYIIAKGYQSSFNAETTLRANGGNYYGGSYDGNDHSASGGQQTTNWAYVVISYDGTNWSLYVNSILQQSKSNTVGALNFPSPWRIGTGSGDYGSGRYFSGNLSEVAIYTNALTAAQVSKHYYSAMLNLDPSVFRPIIVAQPQRQSACVGGNATFSVSTVSALLTTNQWYKAGVPMPGQTNATLNLSGVVPGDDVNYSVVVGNRNGTTNSLVAGLSLFTPANLRWSASGNSYVWDISTSTNWVDQRSSLASVFNTGDHVLFDNRANVSNIVKVIGTVTPGLITVDSASNITFSGDGTISGSGNLVKLGSGTLRMISGANFTGTATISGGSVYAGNYAFRSVSAITVTNGGTLDFAGGQLTGGQPVSVSGAGVRGLGALVNSDNEIYGNNVLALTLTGDVTFGGSSRWDLGAGSSITGPYKITINRSAGVYGEWNSMNISENVGNIEIVSGKLGLINMGSTFGNPAATITIDSGTELYFWSGSGYAKKYHVLKNGAMQLHNGTTALDGNVVLEGGANFNAIDGNGNQTMQGAMTLNGVAHFLVRNANLIFTNIISGSGGFLFDAYNHQIVMLASNTYSGPTVLGGGLAVALSGNGSVSHSSFIFFGGSDPTSLHLDVNGRPDHTFTLANGQTLAGIGKINGNLTVAPGATLSPAGTNISIGITIGANATGTIFVTDAVLLNGTTTLKLNVNDQIQAGAGITYGGTLNLVNISGAPLASGDSFQLFSAASYSGAFVTITPTTPGAGLAWDLSELNIGFVKVVASGSGLVTGSTTVSDGIPMTNWTPTVTNNFDGAGNFSMTNGIAPGTPPLLNQIK